MKEILLGVIPSDDKKQTNTQKNNRKLKAK